MPNNILTVVDVVRREDCCGCSACSNVCPAHAITMKPDEEGFLYPEIDQNLCAGCHLCENACPVVGVSGNTLPNREPKISLFARNKKFAQRRKSSSGGIWKLLSDCVLTRGGQVCGARFIQGAGVCHDISNASHVCNSFLGSKYVQSNIGDTYKRVKSCLDSKEKVIFSGTPCQVAALKTYLNKPTENLITVDFICHGVPSPLVFKKYVEEKSLLPFEKIANVYFRDKSAGWRNFGLRIDKSNNAKKFFSTLSDDLYLQGFLADLYLRPSCYNCRFRDFHGLSDITLADFWSIRKFFPKYDDDYGASLVFVHTQDGFDLINEIDRDILSKEIPFDDLSPHLYSLHCSPNIPDQRSIFFRMLETTNVSTAIKENLPSRQLGRAEIKQIFIRVFYFTIRGLHLWR